MSLPTAIASGPDAVAPDAVSPRRAGLFAAALAGVFVFVTYLFAPVPDKALALVGAHGDGVGRYGGMRLVWVPPQGVDAAQLGAAMTERGAHVRRDGDALIVEVPGIGREEVARSAQLVAAGGVKFHRVVRTEAMPELARTYGVAMPERGGDRTEVTLEVDQWSDDQGGARITDYYLHAPTREQADAVVAAARAKGWALPAGTHLAYEHVVLEGGPPYWRSYVLESEPAFGGERIANATASYDPNTNMPIVLLDLDPEGTLVFGDLTASIIGDKLATVLAGDVVSAPIIRDAIRGGRASITMGGSDAKRQERERDALVGVLKSGPLPPGGTLRSADYVPPAGSGIRTWLARALLATGAGVLVGLVAFVVVRKTRPVWRVPIATLPGPMPWARLGVMLLVPIALFAGTHITAPGLDVEYALGDDSQFNLAMLGLTPLITAFLLVELVATLVPTWRRRRHVSRAPFDLAALVGAAVLALVQAWFIAAYLDRIDAAPIGMARLLFLASLVGATLAFAGIAALVRRFGLGNGYAALITFGWLLDVGRSITRGGLHGVRFETEDIATTLLAIVVFAIVGGVILRLRITRVREVPLRIPTSGVAPLDEARGLIALVFAAAGMIPLAGATDALYRLQAWAIELSRGLALVLVAGLTLLLSYAFARRAALLPYAERTNLAPPSRETWWAATLLSLAVLVVTVSGYTFVGATPHAAFGAVAMLVVGAVVLDIVDDLRGRRGVLSRAWSLQSAHHADLAAHVLGEARIAYHLSGANVRTLFAWFAPFVPIDVYVRAEDTARARELLADVFAHR